MSYWDISQMAGDMDLTSRVAACAAQEGADDPRNWAGEHMLTIAAAPGWADAWASAVANENPSPGRDPGVITDPMILSEVQAELAA